MKLKHKIFYFGYFLFLVAVYYVTSAGDTPYNYFSRLAEAFIHGRYYLTDHPSWLSELVPLGVNKFTFVNPPMPAILLVPFISILGSAFKQQHLAHLIGAGIALVSMGITKVKKGSFLTQLWVGLLTGLGTIMWFEASVGSVWYLGQITAVFFLLLTIYEGLTSKRFFVLGLLLSMALMSRLQILPAILFIFFVTKGKFTKKNLLLFVAGLALFGLTYPLYNYLRFNHPLETGYTLIPGILNEPWFNFGQFSWQYIPKHLKVFLLGLPKVKNEIPFLFPSWSGLAIWITTPAFIYALKLRFNKDGLFSWISLICIALINFCYGSTGVSQFGYRYAVDFYPFLVFLVINHLTKTKLRWHHWTLLVVSMIVNLWGVLWINKFGWVGF